MIHALELTEAPSRELVRMLRIGALEAHEDDAMPEARLWRIFCELRRRGEAGCEVQFLQALRAVLRRRSMGAMTLAVADPAPDDQKLSDDAFLGDLWKAYKRCIRHGRPGPAGQLLRELEGYLLPM